MAKEIQGRKSWFAGIVNILSRIQKILLAVIFWLVIIVVVTVFIKSRPPGVPDKAALVLNPDGSVVEQLSGDPMNIITRMGKKEVLLKDLLDAVNKAKDDKRIQALVLKTGRMGDIGMSKLLDLKSALADFKKTGKKIIAIGDEYNQSGYFLAAQADEIYLNPMGMVMLKGFSAFSNFYKEGLDKFDVDVHVFRVGKYKSAVEPYLRNSMSDEAKEEYTGILNDLWRLWLEGCASGRRIRVEDLENYISHFKDSVIQEHGDVSKVALEAKLVDKIAHRDEIRDRLIELVGEDKETRNYKQIGFKDYLESINTKPSIDPSKKNIVGIVVAKGEISDGTKPPGEIGGDSTAELIRRARLDDNIKAIVLRVDSPGGSANASEIIRRECARARKDGKPVIVSMGSLAASGGYWISTASDEIWASPATITGSIGVFGIFPTLDKTLSTFLGVHVDGVGTTPLAGIDRIDRPFNPELGEIMQQVIDGIYDDFITKVAESRHMKKEAVDAIARGRVWSGEAALKIGLVDKLGDLKDAIKSAASRAGIGEDYQIEYIKPVMTQKEKIISAVFSRIQSAAGVEDIIDGHQDVFMKSLRDMAERADYVPKCTDPNGVYAYCPFIMGE